MYLIIHACVFISYSDLTYLPEDDQNRSKHVGVLMDCNKYNFDISALFGFVIWTNMECVLVEGYLTNDVHVNLWGKWLLSVTSLIVVHKFAIQGTQSFIAVITSTRYWTFSVSHDSGGTLTSYLGFSNIIFPCLAWSLNFPNKTFARIFHLHTIDV
jgi:hypothetical protein